MSTSKLTEDMEYCYRRALNSRWFLFFVLVCAGVEMMCGPAPQAALFRW